MLKLAPSLLLSVLCSNESAAFNVARPAVTSPHRHQATTTSLSMSNGGNNIDDMTASQLSRRNALARFAATATAAAGATFFGANPAFAADAANASEFSPSPTSDASIARVGYDGKGQLVAEADAAPAAEAEAAPAEAAPAETKAGDTDEYGSPESEEGTQASLDPKVALPSIGEIAGVNAKVIAGGVAVVGVLAVLNDPDGGEPPVNPLAKGGPPATPYGLDGGRNNFDGVDSTAAKTAAPVNEPAPAAEEPEEAAAPAAEEKPKWKFETPVPYGIQNKGGKNPFIKNVEEYCVGGKVTEDCSQSIKGYLDDIADTGAVSSSSEVKAIVGYLGTLGSDDSSAPSGKKAGAAFTSYLDALAGGSAPPPSSAKAVKTYLETMNGDRAAAAAPTPDVAAAPAQPEPVAAVAEAPPAAPAWEAGFNQFDNRLTNIEAAFSCRCSCIIKGEKVWARTHYI